MNLKNPMKKIEYQSSFDQKAMNFLLGSVLQHVKEEFVLIEAFCTIKLRVRDWNNNIPPGLGSISNE